MKNEQVFINLTEKCSVYYEDALISKELIIRKYVEFFADSFFTEEYSVRVSLHTGSVCFDIISFFMVALGSLILDETGPDSIIESLREGDFVIYKNQRYRWCGIKERNHASFLVLEQDGRGRNGKSTLWVRFDSHKNLIKPYFGSSKKTDGTGIRQKNSNRVDFISYVFDIPSTEIPSVTGSSVVIVSKRDVFERISRGLKIVYGNGKSIGLLDFVTASYYTESGEEYQYGKNPAKTDPVIKITAKVSTARDLVLSKQGNKVIGLMVIGSDNIVKGSSELIDLLERKSLKFKHLSASIDAVDAESIIGIQENAKVFACTREFLLQNSLPPQENNLLTSVLRQKIENIINNTVSTVIIEGGCSWEKFQQIKKILYTIKQSGWSNEPKEKFIIGAYALLNLINTAVFKIELLEKAVLSNKLKWNISSPLAKINELRELASNAGVMTEKCTYVIDAIAELYKTGFSLCPKYNVLKQKLYLLRERKIAVVLPKAYYIDILKADKCIDRQNITFVTANCFDNSSQYDEIIVVGNFNAKRFDCFKCHAAVDITVLLYECEVYLFKYKKYKAEKLECLLNSKLGKVEAFDQQGSNMVDEIYDNSVNEIAEMESDLEQYIAEAFNVAGFVHNNFGYTENTLKSEICAAGRFVSGEHILFSKYYTAVVFNSIKGTVAETSVSDLTIGDVIVFVKRDDYTRNMVDFIYESLQTSGNLKAEVLDAAEKAWYWKEVLREYKENHRFSYRDIAEELQRYGSSLQEASIRQWLMEESHIIGPREEVTLKQVAELTQDPYLLNDTKSYFEACRIVRHQRKQILELIGRAITDTLTGNKPIKDSILEVVYNNIGSLSETMELEDISYFDEPIVVPISMINKPIADGEVTL